MITTISLSKDRSDYSRTATAVTDGSNYCQATFRLQRRVCSVADEDVDGNSSGYYAGWRESSGRSVAINHLIERTQPALAIWPGFRPTSP